MARQSPFWSKRERLNTVHEPTNLKIGGGLDDVFEYKKRAITYC